MNPASNTRQISFCLEPIKLLEKAQNKVLELTYLATNLLFLNREIEIFQTIDSRLSDLEEDFETVSKKFQTLSMSERREEGNCLIWKMCQIKTLIQEKLRTISNASERLSLENFSLHLTRIEIDYLNPVVISTIGD